MDAFVNKVIKAFAPFFSSYSAIAFEAGYQLTGMDIDQSVDLILDGCLEFRLNQTCVLCIINNIRKLILLNLEASQTRPEFRYPKR